MIAVTGKLTTVQVVDLHIQTSQEEFDLIKGGLVALPDPTQEQFATMQELGAAFEGVTLAEEEE